VKHALIADQVHVHVGISDDIAVRTVAHHQQQNVLVGAVQELVRVAAAGGKARSYARGQQLFVGIGVQHHFAFQHPDEFILSRMGVTV
jgi:hypothetical protein